MEILGIDIGGSGIKGAVVDTDTGALTRARHRIPTPKRSTPAAVADLVSQIVEHFAWEGPIGCAFPARIKQGVATTASNIDKSWIGTNAASLFEEATGCPFLVMNDADAAGVAEMQFGAGRGRQGLVILLTFGTGIGSALFIKQVLVPNTEFGHLYMHGGAAEAYAADSARKREKLGWKVWAKRVQAYLDRIEFLLAPDLLILGGGISKPKRRDLYLPYLRTQAELITADLGNEAGIVGAACSARDPAEVTPLRTGPGRTNG